MSYKKSGIIKLKMMFIVGNKEGCDRFEAAGTLVLEIV